MLVNYQHSMGNTIYPWGMLLPKPSKQWPLLQQVHVYIILFLHSIASCYCNPVQVLWTRSYYYVHYKNTDNLLQHFKNVDFPMRTTNTKTYIKFTLLIAVLLELVLLKQWFCYPCVLRPWRIKILKEAEKLMACVLWDTTIDGSKKCFRRMPFSHDLK